MFKMASVEMIVPAEMSTTGFIENVGSGRSILFIHK